MPSSFFLSSCGQPQSLPPDDAFSIGVLETMRAEGGSIPLLTGHMARFARSALPAPSTLAQVEAQARAIAGRTAAWQEGARVRFRYGVLNGELMWDFSVAPLETSSPWGRGVALSLCRTRVTAEACLSPFLNSTAVGDVAEARNSAAQNSSLGCKLLHRDVYRRAEDELAAFSPDLDAGLFHEGLLLDAGGHVIEGLRTNLLVWRSGHWVTPSLRSCGVRGVMLDWLATRLEIREDDLQIVDIEQADELAVCNAVRGVVPVVKISLEAGAPSVTCRSLSPGPATHRVQQMITDALWSLGPAQNF